MIVNLISRSLAIYQFVHSPFSIVNAIVTAGMFIV